jgi:dipeptidase
MVGDAHETYVFHILSDPTGKSAVWAAQRVPDTHVAVIANMFTLRELNMSEPNNYLASDNVHQVALDHGLWDGTGLLDFTKTYSKGEYSRTRLPTEHRTTMGALLPVSRCLWSGLRSHAVQTSTTRAGACGTGCATSSRR